MLERDEMRQSVYPPVRHVDALCGFSRVSGSFSQSASLPYFWNADYNRACIATPPLHHPRMAYPTFLSSTVESSRLVGHAHLSSKLGVHTGGADKSYKSSVKRNVAPCDAKGKHALAPRNLSENPGRARNASRRDGVRKDHAAGGGPPALHECSHEVGDRWGARARVDQGVSEDMLWLVGQSAVAALTNGPVSGRKNMKTNLFNQSFPHPVPIFLHPRPFFFLPRPPGSWTGLAPP